MGNEEKNAIEEKNKMVTKMRKNTQTISVDVVDELDTQSEKYPKQINSTTFHFGFYDKFSCSYFSNNIVLETKKHTLIIPQEFNFWCFSHNEFYVAYNFTLSQKEDIRMLLDQLKKICNGDLRKSMKSVFILR